MITFEEVLAAAVNMPTKGDILNGIFMFSNSMIGTACHQCGKQCIDGNPWCSHEHYETWYFKEKERIFGRGA